MDTLQATYTDDDDDIEEEPSTHPPPTAASNNDAVLPESNGIIKDEPPTPNIINHHNSPKLPPETDGDDEQDPDDDDLDDDEEEEQQQQQSPTKKQKQIPDSPKLEITEMPSPAADAITLTPLTENGKALVSKASSKKSKKKSKDVWVTSTRKGKKKTKHASSFKHNNDDAAREDEKVLITPVPRFPDRNNDSPELSICLSKVYKAEKVEVSEDRLSAGSTKGYRMVRATRGVTEGAWYFEIKVVHLGETGHTRLGWSTEMADLQAPVGYDGNGYGYRDVDGSKVHKALREKYGEEGYKEGDVIGFYINLPDGESYAPNLSRLIWYKGQRGVYAPNVKEDPPKTVPGSEITYYKNGICQGVAFKDLHGGRYYPAASMYTLPNQPNCVVKFNFGPEFERFPDDFGERPVPRPMIEVPYQSYDARVENGTPWNTTRMCPMLKVMEEDDGEILKGDEIVD